MMARPKKSPNQVDELLDELLENCQNPEDILGESRLIKQLSQRLIERALAEELSHHLKREAESASKSEKHNSRNGYSKKTVQSPQGKMEPVIPRDRNGEFEPVLVPKYERRIAGLDDKILSMYARGLGVRDI